MTNSNGAENATGSARASQALIDAGLGKNLPNGLSNVSTPYAAGLGLANGQKIGGYMLNLPVTSITLEAVVRLIDLCKDPNKGVAILSILPLIIPSGYFGRSLEQKD